MKSIVIYASRYGNTHRLAEAIAETLHKRGDVQLLPADEVSRLPVERVDLVVIGGPTEGHTMTPPIAHMFEGLRRGALYGTATAAFDTRLHGARWLTGSAASSIIRRLRKVGARIIVPAESFLVSKVKDAPNGQYALDPDELDRARAWAATLAEMVLASHYSSPAAHVER
ncbi:MAG TPA: flavodoxin domain-containing protein [Ktedonobacterales bacterium]